MITAPGHSLIMWFYLVTLVGLYYLLRWYRERQVVSHLHDKYVFITGCDSGFGNLLARQLDRRGMRVLAACLTEKGAEELKSKTSDRLETVILDVTNTDSISAATQWVKEHVGDKGLWGLVNNAGVFQAFAYIEWCRPEDCMSIFQVNLIGLAQVTLSMLFLVKKARGRIVNVSSVLGRVALFGGFYSCSKYGVEAFSDVLRREIRDFGVKVSIIEPGSFKTRMTDAELSIEKTKKTWEATPEHIRESYGQQFFDDFCNTTRRELKKCSTNLSLVTDCMEHALTSKYPRTRYSAGWDARLFFIPLSYLPTSLVDCLLAISSASQLRQSEGSWVGGSGNEETTQLFPAQAVCADILSCLNHVWAVFSSSTPTGTWPRSITLAGSKLIENVCLSLNQGVCIPGVQNLVLT